MHLRGIALQLTNNRSQYVIVRLTQNRSGYVVVRLTNNRSRYVIVRLTYFRTALSRIRYGEFDYLRYPDLRLQGFGRICD